MKLQFDLYYSSMVKQLAQVADAKGEKNCPGLMLVVLVNKRSEDIDTNEPKHWDY